MFSVDKNSNDVSDCDSRNTDRRLLDYELNEDYTKSLDAEIEQLKKTW